MDKILFGLRSSHVSFSRSKNQTSPQFSPQLKHDTVTFTSTPVPAEFVETLGKIGVHTMEQAKEKLAEGAEFGEEKFAETLVSLRQVGNWQSMEDHARTRIDLLKASRGGPFETGRTYHALGQILGTQGKHDKAEEALINAMSYYAEQHHRPDIAFILGEVNKDLGLCYKEQEKYPEAIKTLKGAFAIQKLGVFEDDSTNPAIFSLMGDTQTSLGECLGIQKQYPEAEKAFKEALENYGKMNDTVGKAISMSLTHYNIGLCLAQQGKHAEAEAKFVEALQAVPCKEKLLFGLTPHIKNMVDGLQAARNAQGKHMESTGFLMSSDEQGLAIQKIREDGTETLEIFAQGGTHIPDLNEIKRQNPGE